MHRKSELLAIALIILSAIFIRVWDLPDYYLGLDESLHSDTANFSLGKSHLARYYAEIHPPLPYIFIGIAQSIYADPFVMRLASLVPCIIILILIYPILFSIFKTKNGAIIGLAIFSYGNTFVYLSQSTRSYLFALLFLLLNIYYLYRLRDNYNRTDLIKFYLCGFGCLLSDYSVIMHVAALDVILFFILLKNKIDKYDLKLSILFGILHLNLVIIQKMLVNKYSYMTISNLGYLNSKYYNEAQVLLNNFYKTFSENYFYNWELKNFIFAVFILCIFITVIRKNILTLSILLTSIAFCLLVSFLYLFPFLPGRYSIGLSLMALFVIAAGVKHVENIPKAGKVISGAITATIFCCGFSQNFFDLNNLKLRKIQPQKSGYRTEIGLRGSEYEKIYRFVKSHMSKTDLLMTTGFTTPKAMEGKPGLVTDKIIQLFPDGIMAPFFGLPITYKKIIYSNNNDKEDFIKVRNFTLKKPVKIKFWCIDCEIPKDYLDDIYIIDEFRISGTAGYTYSFYFLNGSKRICSK